MIDSLPPGLFDGMGVVGVVLLVGWLIMTDRLVTRRRLEDQQHETNEWRTESRIKDQQIAVKDEQLQHLAEVGRTIDMIMRALPRAADREGH